MTTAQDLVTGALKDLGVIQRTEVPEGQESLDALAVLNFMCSAWIYEDVDMEWLTLALTDVVPYPEDQMLAIRSNLAVRIATQYDVQPNPVILAMASEGFKQLQRAYLDVGTLGIDNAIKGQYQPNGYFRGSWSI